jgi:peptide chain release factor 1
MIEELVKQIETRFAELGAQLTDPEVISDRERYAEVGRAYSQLEPAAKLAAQWRRARDDAEGAEELLRDEGEDSELREELSDANARIEELEEEIRLAMVERDPNDEKSVIVEIQGGAGGDEAGLWAGDLYRMLVKYAERRGWQAEPLDVGEGKFTFAVKGDGAYSVFKFEGGTHRVPRADPHLHSDGCRVAGGGGARRADRPERPADRRLPLIRAGRAVGQYDGLGGPHNAPSVGDRGVDAGREVPAAEP